MLQQRIDSMPLQTSMPPMPTNIRLIIYDIDNCIAENSNDDITIAWDAHLAEKFGLSIEQAKAKRIHYFETVGCTLTGFAREYGLPMSWVDEVYAETGTASGQRFVERFRQRYPTGSPFPKLFWDIRRAGIRQAIVTQGHPNHYRPIIRVKDLDTHVPEDDRIDRTKPPYEKREEAVWRYFLDKYRHKDLQPNQIMVYEDTPANIEWPLKLGMHAVAIGDRKGTVEPEWRFKTPEEALITFLAHQ